MGGGVQHGKAPVSPATGRSCDQGMEAAQHSGGAHCCETERQSDIRYSIYVKNG